MNAWVLVSTGNKNASITTHISDANLNALDQIQSSQQIVFGIVRVQKNVMKNAIPCGQVDISYAICKSYTH